MFTRATKLAGYNLDSLDGEIGEIRDFYFDDRHWAIRYLVANTGNWLPGRQVLISPHALATAMQQERAMTINLTQKQIEDSPALPSDMPVSRQFEEAYYGYFGWPTYWAGPYLWGPYPKPVRDGDKWQETTQDRNALDYHLHNTTAVSGYDIQAGNCRIGNVEDFLIDEETWAIRYLIIDTQTWWPGKKVLISPQWIQRVSWSEAKVHVNLPDETPEYQDSSPCRRDPETRLQPTYAHESHWVPMDRPERLAVSHR